MLSRRDIPNAISIGRIILVLPVALLLLAEEYLGALLLFFVAGFSDGLDGFLAKRYGWHSRLGSILDPLADKLLLVTSYICLAWVGAIPDWLVMIVIGRDLAIVAGAIAFHLLLGRYEMVPTWISKINTVMQIFLVLVLVFSAGVFELPEGLLTFMVYAVCVTTLASGVDYIWTWSFKARRAWDDKFVQSRSKGKRHD